MDTTLYNAGISHYIAVGYKGVVQTFTTARDAKRAPELRVRITRRPDLLLPFIATEEDALRCIEEWYTNLGAAYYAPFQDEIHFIRIGDIWIATEYGAQAWRTPALTADIVPFLQTSDGLVFLGIVRGADPAKGKPALIGGFREVHGKHFQTPLECLLKESREEAGLILSPVNTEDMKQIDQEEMPTHAHIGTHKVPARLMRIGNFHTSSEGETFGGEEKMVNETAAYACLINAPALSIDEIRELLHAGDDASGLIIQSTAVFPDFGILHHAQIYKIALKRVRQQIESNLTKEPQNAI